MTSDQGVTGERDVLPAFSKLAYYSDVETSDTEDDHHFVPPPVTPELLAALLKQVEFYFSDANLPTDKKLLKLIKKDPNGFVPAKVFANFRKVRSMTRELAVIARALEGSKELVMSDDGKSIRRLMPVPEYDTADMQRRIVVVENLPAMPTIDMMTEVFVPFGAIKVVRICADTRGKLPAWLTAGCANPTQQHAFIEFEAEADAIRASEAVFEPQDWRHALKINRLVTQIEKLRLDELSGGGNRRGAGSRGGSRGGSLRSSRDVSPHAQRWPLGRRSAELTTVSSRWGSRDASPALGSSGGGGGGPFPGAREDWTAGSDATGGGGMGVRSRDRRSSCETGGVAAATTTRMASSGGSGTRSLRSSHDGGGAWTANTSNLSNSSQPAAAVAVVGGAYRPPGRRQSDSTGGAGGGYAPEAVPLPPSPVPHCNPLGGDGDAHPYGVAAAPSLQTEQTPATQVTKPPVAPRPSATAPSGPAPKLSTQDALSAMLADVLAATGQRVNSADNTPAFSEAISEAPPPSMAPPSASVGERPSRVPSSLLLGRALAAIASEAAPLTSPSSAGGSGQSSKSNSGGGGSGPSDPNLGDSHAAPAVSAQQGPKHVAAAPHPYAAPHASGPSAPGAQAPKILTSGLPAHLLDKGQGSKPGSKAGSRHGSGTNSPRLHTSSGGGAPPALPCAVDAADFVSKMLAGLTVVSGPAVSNPSHGSNNCKADLEVPDHVSVLSTPKHAPSTAASASVVPLSPAELASAFMSAANLSASAAAAASAAASLSATAVRLSALAAASGQVPSSPPPPSASPLPPTLPLTPTEASPSALPPTAQRPPQAQSQSRCQTVPEDHILSTYRRHSTDAPPSGSEVSSAMGSFPNRRHSTDVTASAPSAQPRLHTSSGSVAIPPRPPAGPNAPLPGRASSKGNWRSPLEGGEEAADPPNPMAGQGSLPPSQRHHVPPQRQGGGGNGSPSKPVMRERLAMSEGGYGAPQEASTQAAFYSHKAADCGSEEEDDEDEAEVADRRARTEGGAPVSLDANGVPVKRKRTRRKRRPSAGGAGGGVIHRNTASEGGAGLGGAAASHSEVWGHRHASEGGGSSGGGGGGVSGLAPGHGVGDGGERAPTVIPVKKKDYASWAAATPEYRAEAVQQRTAAVGSHTVLGGPNGAPGSPPRFQNPLGGSSGGVGGGPVAPGSQPASGPAGHATAPGAIPPQVVHISRGPDGVSAGFGLGRGRPLCPPPA